MATIKFTQDQSKMLDSADKNLLVSASAGSGKTATLIEKIARLIMSGESLKDMLVITFTEASSMEMKIRLRERLQKLSSENASFKEQMDYLPLADISTLHAFCSKMLRKYFYKLNLKPNFAVLDDENAKFLKVKALDKTINFYAGSFDEEFFKLISIFGGRDYEGIKVNLLNFESFLSSLDNKDEFLQKTCFLPYDENLQENIAIKLLNDDILKNFSNMVEFLNEQTIFAEQAGADLFLPFLKQAHDKLSVVGGDFVENCKAIDLITLPRMVYKKNMDEKNSTFKQSFAPLWEEKVKNKVNALKNTFGNKDEQNILQMLEIAKNSLKKFVEVEILYEKYYAELKLKRNGLDFNDLEKFFLQLCLDKEVLESINFKYIFVDEYQDINSVQEKIILNLTGQNSHKIMVGDVKQSIYRFRNSTPQIFVDKSVAYKNDNSIGNLISLNDNFRSNPTILHFVNAIFSKCMNIDFGGVNYQQDGMLSPHTTYQKCSDLPVVEVDIFDTSKKGDDDDSSLVYDKVYSVFGDKNNYDKMLTNGRVEALFIANKILDIVGKVQIFDAKENKTKVANFCDITILCRDNAYLQEVANVLLEKHIPIATSYVSNLYRQQDVDVLVCLLKLLNNFHDDTSLAVVLTSVLGGFSFDELSIIREKSKDEKYFYLAVKNYKENDKIYEKLQNFDAFLSSLRKKLEYMSIFDVLNQIGQNGYFDFVLSLPDGTNRLKFVKDFVDTFKGKDYNFDLASYIDFLDNYSVDNKIKLSFLGGENCVGLSTIHSSKGLEYPIVFLGGSGKDLVRPNLSTNAIFDKDFGVGLYSFDSQNYFKCSNVAREAISLVKAKNDLAEELRLLYVALTRAKNHLFVVGSTKLEKTSKPNTPQDATNAKCYLDWILSSLSQNNFVGLAKNGKNVCLNLDDGKAFFNIVNFQAKNAKNEDLSLEDLDINKNAEEIATLKKYLQNTPNFAPQVALKNSVSALLREHTYQGESLNLAPKKLGVFEGESQSVSSATLGTYYHKIMEQIDYLKDFNKTTFDAILQSLNVEKDYLPLITFDKIDKCVKTLKTLGITSAKKEIPFISYLPYNQIFGGETKQKVIVQGVADLILKCGEKHFLIDFKTTKTSSAEYLAEKYRVQLALYKLCLQKALNITFENVFVYSFAMDTLIKVF